MSLAIRSHLYFHQIINLSFFPHFRYLWALECNAIHYSDIYECRCICHQMARSFVCDFEGQGDVQLCLWFFRQLAGMKKFFKTSQFYHDSRCSAEKKAKIKSSKIFIHIQWHVWPKGNTYRYQKLDITNACLICNYTIIERFYMIFDFIPYLRVG